MAIYQLGRYEPKIHASAYIADEAIVIGNVTLAENVNVWPGAVIRADSAPISIARDTNIQDGAILHADPGAPLIVGEGVTVGHQAVLHGCMVGNGALIGIQAVVLNHASVGKHCLVGAAALVTEHKTFEDMTLILGAPAKSVRRLDENELEGMRRGVQSYLRLAVRCKSSLHRL